MYLSLTDQLWLQVTYKAYNILSISVKIKIPVPDLYTTSASLYILHMCYSVPLEVINPGPQEVNTG